MKMNSIIIADSTSAMKQPIYVRDLIHQIQKNGRVMSDLQLLSLCNNNEPVGNMDNELYMLLIEKLLSTISEQSDILENHIIN